MKIYVNNGVTNLDEIVNHYNRFSEGGSKETVESPNTVLYSRTPRESVGNVVNTRPVPGLITMTEVPRIGAGVNIPMSKAMNDILSRRAASNNTNVINVDSINATRPVSYITRPRRINRFDEGGTKWKALDNIDFKVIQDSTFTRDKTGAGSIEYFQKEHPEGIIYPNGYRKPHPSPGNDVILYNPKENDEQDIRLDALHIMPKDATYDALNTIYREAAKNSDVAWNAKHRYDEDVKNYGKENLDPFIQYFNNEADGLLRNMFIEGTPEYIASKRYYPDKAQLREWNKYILPEIDAIQQYLETGERPQYILPEVVITPNKKKYGGKVNRFDEGGETYISKEALPEVIITPKTSALARSREATSPNINFRNAQDMSLWSKIGATLFPFITDPHTCLNTITGFYNPDSTAASNPIFISNPEKWGFTEIDQKDVQPGDVIILSNKKNHPTHAVLFDSVAEEGGIHNKYAYEAGDTLVNYSNGGRGINDYRLQGPLSRFDDPNMAGGDFSGKKRYYTYVGKKKKNKK
jgi:hypothetical protein